MTTKQEIIDKLSEVCQFCMGMKQLRCLFELHYVDGEPLHYPDIILSCFNLKIEPIGYCDSTMICESCINQITQAHSFKQQMQKSIYHLQQYLNTERTILQSNDDDNVNIKHNIILPIWEDVKCELDSGDDSHDYDNSAKIIKPKDILNSSVKKNKTDNKKKRRSVHRQNKFKKKSTSIKSIKKDTISDESNERNYCCNVCENVFKSMTSLRSHRRSHVKDLMDLTNYKEDIYKCKKCNKQYKTLLNLRTHIRRHINTKKYICDKCSRKFSNSQGLKIHMNKHNGVFDFQCDICGRSFPSRGMILQHMKSHYDPEHMCTLCKRMFIYKSNLKLHMLYVHKIHDADISATEAINRIRHRCPECKLAFNSEPERRSHLQMAHQLSPVRYECNECSKVYMTTKGLKIHKQIHHLNQRDHMCEQCGSKFSRKRQLSEHMLKHSGNREFHCHLCKKKFIRKSHLAAHLKTHSPPQHKCNECERYFSLESSLKVHVRSAHNV